VIWRAFDLARRRCHVLQVTRDDFEHQLLSLWMTTRVPFTRANLQFVTGVPRGKLGTWLDALVADGVLDVDSDDAGELLWSVRGAARTTSGPDKPEDVRKLAELKKQVRGSTALVKAGAAALSLPSLPSGGGEHKSLIASGILSFFLGPFGWIYAAPLKEAGVAILGYLILCMVLPHVLLAPLLGVMAPLSAAIGVAYAYRNNQKGERTSLLPDKSRRALPRRVD
jgi:hypothetical protein